MMTRVALIGAGYWGKNLARNFHAIGALHTLCDSQVESLNRYAEDLPGVRFETSLTAVLADPDVDAVAISTPAASHFEFAKAAIEAGKDVYVEKPLCLCPKQGEALVDFAAKSGRILMVGHLLQYHPCVERLVDLVNAGELGRIFQITSNRLNLGKIRQEENSLWSFAPHDISVILRLVGELPSVVYCHGAAHLTPGVADSTHTHMKFASQIEAHIHVSWLNPFKEQKLTVTGSEGMAVFDDTKPWEEKLILHRKYLSWAGGNRPAVEKHAGEAITVSQTEPLRNECQHFVDRCLDRASPRTDGAEGLGVLRVLDAAQQSLERGDGKGIQPAVPSDKFFAHETSFVDDPEAIGSGSMIWHFSHVSKDCRVGKKCNIGQNVFVAPGVTIGSNVKIQNNVSLYTGTEIEDDVFLGPSCVLTNVSNPRSQINRRAIYEKTKIMRGATIGANATVVCGTTLGKYAFVAAGAVVTKSFPDYAYVRGVPARQVGWMSRHGHPLKFTDGLARCPESGLEYILSDIGDSVVCKSIAEDVALESSMSTGNQSYREIGS